MLLFQVFLLHDIPFVNASCAIILLSVSAFRSPLDPTGTCSSIISCQSILYFLYTGHALLCFTIFLGLLTSLCVSKAFFVPPPPLFSFEMFNNSTTFAYALTV